MLLNLDFNSMFSALVAPRPTINPDNQQVAVMGRLYGTIYGWLKETTKSLIQEWEREIRADQIPDEVVQVTSELYLVPSRTADKLYQTTPHSCTCPDHTYRHRECIHIKRLRSSTAYMPGKSAEVNTNLLSDSALAKIALQAREDLGI